MIQRGVPTTSRRNNNKTKKKTKLWEGKEPPELFKVTAKKGTLAHLKQRQMRLDYLLQQQREDEELDDFFDDVDNPDHVNFHKAKNQLSDLFLDLSATSDSTIFTCCNISLGSVPQTPPPAEKGKKRNIKKQNDNRGTATAPSKTKNGRCVIKTDVGYSFGGTAFSPRSALLAEFAGDESEVKGLLVNTPTTSGKRADLGVNLGLAMTPGELLDQSVANRIIYNNKRKRPRKRLVFTSPTPLSQSSLEGSSSDRVIKHSGSCHLPMIFSDGSLGQSPDSRLRKRAGRLSEVAVEYDFAPNAGAKGIKQLKLPSILTDLASQEEEDSDHDDYFEDSDN